MIERFRVLMIHRGLLGHTAGAVVRAYHCCQNKRCRDVFNLYISYQLHDKLRASYYTMKFLSLT